jgi:hypothetical protein
VSAGDQYQLRLNPTMPEWTKQSEASDGGLPYWARCMAPQSNYRDGTWHHLAAVSSEAGMALYFDGALICKNAEGGSIVYNKGPHLWVGRHGNLRPGYNFDGNLDDVRVYTRVLSDDEIRSLALGAGFVGTDGGTSPRDGGADAVLPDAGDAGVADVMDAGTDAVPAEAATQTPYGGTPWPIPGTIEAESYDVGGEGISFHDTTPGNLLAQFRTGANEDVDIEKQCGSGCFDVSAVVASEWLEYTVNVTTAGMYKVGLNVSAVAPKKLHIEMDGVNVTGVVTVTSTGSNTTFLDENPAVTFPLTSGQKTMRIVFEDTSVNLNWVKFLLQ